MISIFFPYVREPRWDVMACVKTNLASIASAMIFYDFGCRAIALYVSIVELYLHLVRYTCKALKSIPISLLTLKHMQCKTTEILKAFKSRGLR